MADPVGAIAGHEFQHEDEDKTNAHRLVATSMIIVFVVTAISQGWWKHVRDFIATKTRGGVTVTPPGGPGTQVAGPGSGGGGGGGSW